jgi:glycosyltransferase involved in cell wall biosynthesis
VLPVGTDESVFHPEVHPTKLDLRKTSAQPESALDKPKASLSDGEVAIATSTAEKSVMYDQNGSDEAGILRKSSNKSEFSVFFYGNVLPLHGLEVMLDATLRLKDYTDISFIFVGGKQKHRELVETAIVNGARITYKTRVPFDELPTYVHNASLCLGGPFGDTYQSQHVITGKTYQFLAAAAPTVVGSSNASSVFTDKKDCLLVPQGNAAALADAILWSKEHSKQLTAIGNAGRDLYEKAFSNEVIAQRLANLV